jgi:Leucine-rich repeat (LRR) protein
VYLQELNLSHNNIEKLEGISCLTALQTLDVTGNYILSIPRLSKLKNLHTFRLADNRISSLEDIRNLKVLGSLSILTLSGNPVSDSEHTRLYAIYQAACVDSIDGQAVDMPERRQAAERFARGKA